jgi:hypothetical protein
MLRNGFECSGIFGMKRAAGFAAELRNIRPHAILMRATKRYGHACVKELRGQPE